MENVFEKTVKNRIGLNDSKLLFCTISGSNKHNLSKPENSDTDYWGIYQTPTSKQISLNVPKSTVSCGGNEDKENFPDHTFHELKKYIELLVKGNPEAVETLFIPDHYGVTSSPEFERIKELRKGLLTKKLLKGYIGFLKSNLSKVKKGTSKKSKKMYHVFRMIFECRRILNGGSPIVYFPDGEEREFIMKIRNDETDLLDLINIAERHVEELEEKEDSSELPEKADSGPFDELLVEIRKGFW